MADYLNSINAVIEKSHAYNSIHYQLRYNPDFPCQVTLVEDWNEDGASWHQQYRFDLTDVEPNHFVQSKAGRRAIIYSGSKTLADGDTRSFREKRINQLTYRAGLYDEDQMAILQAFNKAVGLCEEEYGFAPDAG